jgi:hypothetical protein
MLKWKGARDAGKGKGHGRRELILRRSIKTTEWIEAPADGPRRQRSRKVPRVVGWQKRSRKSRKEAVTLVLANGGKTEEGAC